MGHNMYSSGDPRAIRLLSCSPLRLLLLACEGFCQTNGCSVHVVNTFCRIGLPFLARNGRCAMSELSPLSGVKRKSVFGAVRAAFDPKRSFRAPLTYLPRSG